MFTAILALLAPFRTYLIFGAIALTVLGGFYWYYQDSQTRIANLQKELVATQLVVTTQNETIKKMKEDAALAQKVQEETNKDLQDARDQITKMDEDLAALQDQLDALNKPVDPLAPFNPAEIMKLEQDINTQINQANKCFALYSGVPIDRLEKDKNAQAKLRRACGGAGR
jgi:Mg2+ and Co2+ transporter CorA